MRYRVPRYPANSELGIEHEGTQHRARLVDISSTGARLRGIAALTDDAQVTLCHLYRRIGARVVWSKEHYFGVEFLQPLGAEDLAALRGVMASQMRVGAAGHHSFRELR